MVVNRILNNKLHHEKYERIWLPLNLCIYCSDQAEVYDHVPPISLAYQYHGHFITVPSCKECNAFLSNKPIITLSERRKEIVKCIYRNRKNILGTPEWGNDELKEITGYIHSYVKNFVIKKRFYINKIKCLEEDPTEEFIDYIRGFKGIYENI